MFLVEVFQYMKARLSCVSYFETNGWVWVIVALLLSKINHISNDQRWLNHVLLSRQNLLDYAWIWICILGYKFIKVASYISGYAAYNNCSLGQDNNNYCLQHEHGSKVNIFSSSVGVKKMHMSKIVYATKINVQACFNDGNTISGNYYYNI